jgi:hypothetical protein
MKINLNAYRNSKGDTDVSIKFSEIFNVCFKLVATQKITDSTKTHEAVIFHFKNEKGARIESSGNDDLVFSENFTLKTNYIRVFYLNDSEDLRNSLDCFIKFLDDYGLRENAPEIVNCPYPNTKEKAMAIPRQAGNGGVVGIVNIP